MSMERFRSLLQDNHTWPTSYTFKMVVPKEQQKAICDILPVEPSGRRWSKNGRYVSLTATTVMSSPDAVLAVYEKASAIPGLIAL